MRISDLPWKRIFVLFAYLSMLLLCAIYTLDIEQNNNEKLFLSHTGLESYQAFQDMISEHRVLVVQYEKDFISSSDWNAVSQLKQSIKTSFPKVIFFGANEVYGASFADPSFGSAKVFFKENKQIMLPLLGESHLALLLALPQEFKNSQLEAVMNIIEDSLTTGKISFGGLPYINHTLNAYTDNIRFTIFPLMFIVSFILSMIICGSFKNGLIVFIPSLLATFVSLFTIKYFFASMNMISSIVPLMMSVVNLCSAYHLYFACISSVTWEDARKKKILPIGLMILTTAIGFGSLGVSDIAVIRQFAILCASLIFITFSLNIGWFWLCFPFLDKKKPQQVLIAKIIPARLLSLGMRPRSIFLVVGVTLILAGALGRKIPFLTDATAYFPKKSQLRESIRRVEQRFLGNPTFDLLLRPKSGHDFNFQDLRRIAKLEESLALEFSGTYRVLSRNSIVAEGNSLYSGIFSLPRNKFAYKNIEGSVSPEFLQSFPRKQVYRLSLMGSSLNKKSFEAHKSKIGAQDILKDFNWEFNGLHYQMMEAQNNLIGILSKSFLLSLLLISLIAFTYFRNSMVFLVFLVVNLMPVLGSIVFMVFAGLSINIATVMAFSISLGMIVDSTIHLTYDISKKTSWEVFYETTLIPVMASSFLVVVSFALFILSDFLPIWQIGILLSFSISIGLIMDLFVLPTLLLRTNRYDKALL